MKENLNEVASTHYPPGPGYRSRLRSPGLLRLSTQDFLQRNARAYGDLVHFRAFGRHVFQFNHPDMVQEVLIRDAGMQHRGIVMQRAKFVLGDGLLTSEEPTHMRQRKLVSAAFHRQRIEAYGETMLQFTDEMMSNWKTGEIRDIHRSMLELTLRVAGKCLFDSDVKSDVQTISDSVTAFMGFLPLAFLPCPHLLLKIPFGILGRIQKSRKKLDSLIYTMIAERRKTKADHGDLLSMLLASQDTEVGTGTMTDRQVRDECLTLLLAGHETTANGLSFVFFLMAQTPRRRKKSSPKRRRLLKTGQSILLLALPESTNGFLIRSARSRRPCGFTRLSGSRRAPRPCRIRTAACLFLPGRCCWSRKLQSIATPAGSRSPCSSTQIVFCRRPAQRVPATPISLLGSARACALEKTLPGWRPSWCSPAWSANGA